MNPGPAEEAGQTARGIIDAMKDQPLVLGLLLINLAFICIFFFGLREQSARKDAIIADLIHLVAQCPAALVPQKQSEEIP